MLSCVIFDMDGTILDTERISIDAWQRAGKKYGYDIPREFIIGFFGMERRNIDQLYLDKFGADFPIKKVRACRMEEGERFYRENPVPVKSGAFELLRYLRKKEIKTALATSTALENASFELKKAGLFQLFDVVVCGDMVEHGKPAPDIFIKALEEAKCLPEQALVVEDTENGARGSIAAGCRTIIVPDLRQPGEEIRKELYGCCASLLDILPMIDELIV